MRKPLGKLIERALRALEDENGRLSPEIIIKAAKSPKSPLHEYFEWDDSKAAHAHRLEQARQIIRVVCVEVKVDHKTVQAVCYVRDPGKERDEQGYVSLEQLKSEPENAMSMILAELGRVESALNRAESLAEALDLARLITPVAKKVRQTRKKFMVLQEQSLPVSA